MMALLLIDEPEGTYYGGSVAGPVMNEFLQAVLPVLGVEQEETYQAETKVTVPNVTGVYFLEGKKILEESGLTVEVSGEGEEIASQFPRAGEVVNRGQKVQITLKEK